MLCELKGNHKEAKTTTIAIELVMEFLGRMSCLRAFRVIRVKTGKKNNARVSPNFFDTDGCFTKSIKSANYNRGNYHLALRK